VFSYSIEWKKKHELSNKKGRFHTSVWKRPDANPAEKVKKLL